MQYPPSALMLAAALLGAIAVAVWCHWRASRTIHALQARLQASEMARRALLERSDQARAQIGQLTKALATVHRVARGMQPPPAPAPQAEASEAPQDLLLQPDRSPPQAFADTQVLDRERPGLAGSPLLQVKRA